MVIKILLKSEYDFSIGCHSLSVLDSGSSKIVKFKVTWERFFSHIQAGLDRLSRSQRKD